MTKYNEFENDRYLLQTNLLNIKSMEELEEAGAFTFTMRAIQIEKGLYPITSFTKTAFIALHRHLFQDVYPFAGKFRNVQLTKGTTRFCQTEYLASSAQKIFQALNHEPIWDSLDKAAARMTFYKAELNMLHPFREGNGRTIRIFLHAYAKSKGFVWKYENMDRDEYIQAMIHSVTNEDLLLALFLKTLTKIK